MSRATSTTSPACCKPPTGLARRNRCCDVFWRSSSPSSARAATPTGIRDPATAAYTGLLAAMGKTEADINATLVALAREAGLDPG